MNFNIPEELEKRLRIAVVERFGGRKGDLTTALIQAIELWLETEEVSNG